MIAFTEKMQTSKIFVSEQILQLNSLADTIMKDQTPQNLKQLRERISSFLINGVPISFLFSFITKNLLSRSIIDTYKREILYSAAKFDKRSAAGTKEIVHFEAFLARVFCCLVKAKREVAKIKSS